MRRQRYTAEHEDGNKTVHLGYSAASLTDFLVGRGYKIARVTKGDYRVEALAQGGGWTLDQAGLKQALDFLGIEFPVEVKQTAHRGGGGMGMHMLTPYGGSCRVTSTRIFNLDSASGFRHEIRIKRTLSPHDAGRTLWHELAHAMQAERELAKVPTGSPIRARWEAWKYASARGRGKAYKTKPVEIEADSYMDYNAEIPLAR